jgi:isopentenyl diphosphate isomerase/L-lactate dehydrogenase-like FMN-dependent dehydrogenase
LDNGDAPPGQENHRGDGPTKQLSNTEQMVFGVAKSSPTLSSIMTLEPGDVIATGTPAGTGHGRKPPQYLAPGELVTPLPQGIMHTPLNIADFRSLARRRLPKGVFDAIDRGSEDDVAERRNREAFETLRLRPRILAGAAPRSLAVQVLGEAYAMPVGIAPMGVAAYVWRDAEVALARAASAMEVPFVLSGATTIPLETVMARGGAGPKWFQLYVSGDHARALKLAPRVHEAGYSTIVLTVDSLTPYRREFATRSGFDMPFRLRLAGLLDIAAHPSWLLQTILPYLAAGGLPQAVDYPIAPPGSPEAKGVALKADDLDWAFLAELRRIWPGKLVVKGVLDPRDADRCAHSGVDAIVVSNHGGIALDGSLAPLEALPDIVAAVRGRLGVIMDGGVRRGSDVVKALALGADLVLIGRAALYALAADGERGVVGALSILRTEIDRTLAQVGCRTIADLTADHVTLAPAGHTARNFSRPESMLKEPK